MRFRMCKPEIVGRVRVSFRVEWNPTSAASESVLYAFKMAESKLSADDLDQFIDLYYNMKCLWDVRCKEYRDLTARNKAYATIADNLNISVEVVKKKINNLRSTYNQEKKKVVASQTTGTGTEDIYEPSLPWFTKMRFLDDAITPRKTVCSQEKSKIPHASTIENKEKESTVNRNETPHSTTFVKKRRIANDCTINKEFDSALKTFKEACAAESSEFDKFGESVASQLKSMPLKHALELQLELQQSITKKRLKLLENVNVSGNSFTPIIVERESRPSISLQYTDTSRPSTSLSNTIENTNSPDMDLLYDSYSQDSNNAIYVAMQGANIL